LRAAEGLRRLLRFLADKTFSGEANDLKEYSVGLDGVGKPSDYDPRHDSGVRLQASRLRQKLDEYYRAEGANDRVIVELPKGRFKIAWRERPGEAPRQPDATVSPAQYAVPVPAPVVAKPAGRNIWRILALSLAAVSLSLAAVNIRMLVQMSNLRGAGGAVTRSSPELEALWNPFTSSGHRLTIAFSDPLFIRFHEKGRPDLVFRRNSLSRWEDAIRSPEFAALSRMAGNRADGSQEARPSFDFALRCDLVSAFVLGQFFAPRRGDVSITRLGELSWQQFADDDVILLAPRSRIDEKQSALPVRPAFLFGDQGIRNLKPLPGEAALYSSSQDQEDGSGDALELVSVMPGPLGRTRVISFANNRVWAGPGAVQSLTDPAFARVVVEKLRGAGRQVPPFYQLVIRISYRGGTAVSSSYVTHRVLTVTRNSADGLGQ
jgi:hypothetical protein